MEDNTMKKQYMKPTVHVVVLQQQCHILAGSAAARGLNGTPEGMNWPSDGIGDDDVLR